MSHEELAKIISMIQKEMNDAVNFTKNLDDEWNHAPTK